MKIIYKTIIILFIILLTYVFKPTTIIQSDYEITNAADQIVVNTETVNEETEIELETESVLTENNQIKASEGTLKNIKLEEQIDTSNNLSNLKNNFEELLKINNQTKGWLTVNNTNVNYPVVQTDDNDYYLNYNFYNQQDKNGWAFLDYRASIDNLYNNTIIFGHFNNDGTMFGSLKKVLNESWYTNLDNQIITFNTLNKNMKWQIFAIYTIPVTNDYLYLRLNTIESYNNFVDMVVARSIYDFGNKPTFGEKILTISTCYITSDYRLVIHAKLINE